MVIWVKLIRDITIIIMCTEAQCREARVVTSRHHQIFTMTTRLLEAAQRIIMSFDQQMLQIESSANPVRYQQQLPRVSSSSLQRSCQQL